MTDGEMRDLLIAAMESSARGNTYTQWADTIMPTVRRIVAAELRAAATAWARSNGLAYEDWQAHEFLRDRADELDPR